MTNLMLLAQEEGGMLSAFFNLRNLILLAVLVAVIVFYVMYRRRQM